MNIIANMKRTHIDIFSYVSDDSIASRLRYRKLINTYDIEELIFIIFSKGYKFPNHEYRLTLLYHIINDYPHVINTYDSNKYDVFDINIKHNLVEIIISDYQYAHVAFKIHYDLLIKIFEHPNVFFNKRNHNVHGYQPFSIYNPKGLFIPYSQLLNKTFPPELNALKNNCVEIIRNREQYSTIQQLLTVIWLLHKSFPGFVILNEIWNEFPNSNSMLLTSFVTNAMISHGMQNHPHIIPYEYKNPILLNNFIKKITDVFYQL
jgi:hypothetical protein